MPTCTERPGTARTAVSSVVALVAALLTACTPEPRTQAQLPASNEWDLVLIVLDSLPASALSCYGYPNETTPNIDALAADALRFGNVFAPAASTLPSTVSLFTGLSPAAHGCVDDSTNALAEEHRTLAEALEMAGFRGLGISTSPRITPEAGFGQGFETFEYRRGWSPPAERGGEPDDAAPHTLPESLVDDAAQWWSRTAAGAARRFLYLHLLPPHAPYDPPDPWNLLFDADRTERRDGSVARLRRLAAEPGGVSPTDPRVRDARRRYDASLAYADSVVGELLDRLGADRGLANAVIVVTADHGEAFGEHGRVLHGDTVHTEAVRVPLIMRWPLMQPGVHDGLVRQRDLAATLGELLLLPWLKGAGNGRSFLRPAVERHAELVPLCVSRSDGAQPVWSLRAARWNLFVDSSTGVARLYDRQADPLEQRDVAADHPDTVTELTERLDKFLEHERSRSNRLPKPGAVPPRADDLRALGYPVGQ